MDFQQEVVESLPFVNHTYTSGSGTWRHKPTKEEWNTILLPELIRLKNEGFSNAALLQALLDEGYITSLSTVERKLHAIFNLQLRASDVVHTCDIINDEILEEHFETGTSDADNAVTWMDDATPVPVPQAIADADFTSMDFVLNENDDTTGVQTGMDDQDSMFSQSAQDANDDVVSQTSPEPAALSVRSGCSRSIQESSDKTVKSESTHASTFGRMLQTSKRAQRNLDAMRKDAVKPKLRLPPAVPSSGQKVEEWHNDAWRLRYSDVNEYWEAAKA